MLTTTEKSPAKEAGPDHKKLNLFCNKSISDRLEFVKLLFENISGYVEIREIREIGNNGQVKQKFLDSCKDIESYDPPADKNVYVGMLTRKAKKGTRKACKHTRVLWADYDDMSQVEAEYRLDMSGLPYPSMIINSGHGIHCYWILNKIAGAEVEPVVKAIANQTEADGQAAEIARVMRLPGTINVKSEPVECKIIEKNNKVYALEDITEVLGIKPERLQDKATEQPQQAAEALNVDYQGIISEVNKPCIKSMLQGVPEGERNWILGRLTKHFKNQLGYSKNKTKKIIRVWNLKNDPPQPESELLASFNKYWHTDYNLEGCRITDKEERPIPQLQQILNKYCDKDSCPLSKEITFQKDQSVVEYNNWLFNHIKELNVYELIIYGILAINKQGLTADRAAEIIGITKKTFRKHAKKSKFIKKKDGIKQRGIKDLYYLSKKGTYALGRTKISYAAVRTLNGELKQNLIRSIDIKVYMFLRYIEFKSKNGEVYPATATLAEKLNRSRPRISKSVNRLEKRNIIKIDRQKRRSNTYEFIVR